MKPDTAFWAGAWADHTASKPVKLNMCRGRNIPSIGLVVIMISRGFVVMFAGRSDIESLGFVGAVHHKMEARRWILPHQLRDGRLREQPIFIGNLNLE